MQSQKDIYRERVFKMVRIAVCNSLPILTFFFKFFGIKGYV